MSGLLDIAGLTVAIGGVALVRSVSLSVSAGEIVGLAGDSGTGKSLTALAVLGLLPRGAAVSGSILFAGHQIAHEDTAALRRLRGREIGMVFQEPMTALNPVMRIGDQVAETLLCHGVPRVEARRRAEQTLEQVGLAGSSARYAHQLSGGQRQRVAIAIAIALQPRLLIADEPTTALDVTTQAQIIALLRRLVRETDMGLLLISHDVPLMARTAHRVLCLGETAPVPCVLRRRPGAIGDVLLAGSGIVRDYRHPRCRAVDGVDIAIRAGESVALVGESGSGKSTLLRTLLALDAPQAGTVTLDGKPITRAARRRIQAVFQDPAGSFDPRWRVEKLVAEPLTLLDRPLPPVERRGKVEAVLQQVGLSPTDADRFPHEFSGGQRQRIAIARALVVEPAIIAFDEATSALDMSAKMQILGLLADLATERRLAFLFVTHDLAAMRQIADRVLVMQAGRIVEEGAARQIFTAPRHPYTAALIEAQA
jgi:peptide/nickel transport system ATP-binding protein